MHNQSILTPLLEISSPIIRFFVNPTIDEFHFGQKDVSKHPSIRVTKCWPNLNIVTYLACPNNVNYKILPMSGFEPRTSCIGSERSVNWATTTAQNILGSCTWLKFVYNRLMCQEAYLYMLMPYRKSSLAETNNSNNDNDDGGGGLSSQAKWLIS